MIILGLLIILALVVGVLFAAHSGVWGLHLNLELKPFEIITLGVNISIAYLLQYYLANKTRDLRGEKDLLIGSLNDVIGSLRACRDVLSGCEGYQRIPRGKTREVYRLLKQVSNGIHHLESAVRLSHCRKLGQEVATAFNSFDRYRAACTNSPFPVKSTPTSGQDRAYNELYSNLQDLLFKINKHH
jgi:hypothetical protein